MKLGVFKQFWYVFFETDLLDWKKLYSKITLRVKHDVCVIVRKAFGIGNTTSPFTEEILASTSESSLFETSVYILYLL